MHAHQASRTALRISRLLLYIAADPRRAPLLAEGSAEATESLLRAAGLLEEWRARAYRAPRSRSMRGWLEGKLLPGESTYVALRKRVLDDETRAAISDGATQVLIIGAGFDTLGLRLARKNPRVRFVEIDHPATQSLKRHALAQVGRPENLVLHPADLAQTPVPEVLDELHWNRNNPSVVIAESVLTYLAEDEVGDFLRGVANVIPPGSRLLGTHLMPQTEGRATRSRWGGLLRTSLERLGEPPRWAVSPELLAQLLVENGFRPRREPGRGDLRLRYLVPMGLDDLALAEVERVLIADRL